MRIHLWCGLLAVLGCAQHDLRGTIERSRDGRTYLVIADANGGKCGPMRVDGVVWPHAVGVAGTVTPGAHSITCGADVRDSGIAVHVDSGTTFRFDYWGP